MAWAKRLLVVGIPAAFLQVPAGSGTATPTGLSGYRWDPCQPITYRVSETGGYDGSLAHIQRAFARIGRASGITFVYDGRTPWVAYVTGRDPDADITVSWAHPKDVPKLGGAVAGLSRTGYVVHDGVRENVNGQIVLDTTQGLTQGFRRTGPPTWGQAFLHEIGHVIGLAHSDRPADVMYPAIGRPNHRLSPADRSRLTRVGAGGGCVRRSLR